MELFLDICMGILLLAAAVYFVGLMVYLIKKM
jgi:hypothetical protein